MKCNTHCVNENYKNGKIDSIKVDSVNNIADIITKSLAQAKFVKLRECSI